MSILLLAGLDLDQLDRKQPTTPLKGKIIEPLKKPYFTSLSGYFIGRGQYAVTERAWMEVQDIDWDSLIARHCKTPRQYARLNSPTTKAVDKDKIKRHVAKRGFPRWVLLQEDLIDLEALFPEPDAATWAKRYDFFMGLVDHSISPLPAGSLCIACAVSD